MCKGCHFTPHGSDRCYRTDMGWVTHSKDLILSVVINYFYGSPGTFDCDQGCKGYIAFVSRSRTHGTRRGGHPSQIGLSLLDFALFEFCDLCLTDSDEESCPLDPVDFATPEHTVQVKPIAYICQSDAMVVKDLHCGDYYIVPDKCVPSYPFKYPLIDAQPIGRCLYQLGENIVTDNGEDHSRRWVQANILMDLPDALVLALPDYNLDDFWSGYVVCSKNSGRFKWLPVL